MASNPKSTSPTKPKSSRERVREHRARMRAQGLKQVTFWVPDVRSPEFLAEARRQALAVAGPGDKEDQDFIDAVSVQFDDE